MTINDFENVKKSEGIIYFDLKGFQCLMTNSLALLYKTMPSGKIHILGKYLIELEELKLGKEYGCYKASDKDLIVLNEFKEFMKDKRCLF